VLALGGGSLDPQSLQAGRWPFQALRVQAETETFQTWARSRARPRKHPAKENP
jgi:hypothetical protein